MLQEEAKSAAEDVKDAFLVRLAGKGEMMARKGISLCEVISHFLHYRSRCFLLPLLLYLPFNQSLKGKDILNHVW